MSKRTLANRPDQDRPTLGTSKIVQWLKKHEQKFLYIGGAAFLFGGLAHFATAQSLVLNDERIRCAAHQLLALTEGNLGALLMVVAGIGTIISGAFGAYRAATSLLVVAISAFVLRSFVHIFFNLGSVNPSVCALTSSLP
ncbi:MAG: hypothetical protein KDD66_04490 [Bdellovibrionales bacterium]|nr:hypothetical protein [Bdellovibrionales bacterium]